MKSSELINVALDISSISGRCNGRSADLVDAMAAAWADTNDSLARIRVCKALAASREEVRAGLHGGVFGSTAALDTDDGGGDSKARHHQRRSGNTYFVIERQTTQPRECGRWPVGGTIGQ